MRDRRPIYHPDLVAITVTAGRRALHEKAVVALMDSMGRIGLRTPITLRVVDERHILVTGAHRLEAARRLGWQSIDAWILDEDEITDADAELWEIDENLCRSELTPAEQAECLAKRKRLFEAKVTQDGLLLTGRGNKGFASATETATGIDKNTINRAVARAEKIAPEVLADVKGTADDKGVVLDRLARQQGEDAQRAELDRVRVERAARDARPRPLPVDPQPAPSVDPAEEVALLLIECVPPERHAALIAGLQAARPADVIRHLRTLARPVFDRTSAGAAA